MKTTRTWFNLLLDLPFVGPVIAIVNNYVAGGAFSADDRLAPLRSWIKFIMLNFGVPAALTGLIVLKHCNWTWVVSTCDVSKLFSPGALTTSVLPSVLGFGIGVYALVFILSPKFVQLYHSEAQKENRTSEGMTVLAVNSDMAFPLVVIVVTLMLGVLQTAFADSLTLKIVNWHFLMWSLFETLALIGVIYRLGEQSLIEKIPD